MVENISNLLELEGNLGFQRDQMPQIDPMHIGHFIAWIKERYGITSKPPAMLRVDQIRPTQKYVHKGKLDNKWKEIVENGLGVVMKTLIISKDGFQLDGHNTVKAIRRNLGDDVVLPYILVDEKMETLLDMAKEYPYTTYKSINDLT